MAELDMTRSAADRRVYALAGVGTLHVKRWPSQAASAVADGRRWEIARGGVWRRTVRATDSGGVMTGRFTASRIRRGGSLRWMDRPLALRPASGYGEHYTLTDGDRELALLEGRISGLRPAKVTITAPDGLDPGLLLFAAFVVCGLTNDASAAALDG